MAPSTPPSLPLGERPHAWLERPVVLASRLAVLVIRQPYLRDN